MLKMLISPFSPLQLGACAEYAELLPAAVLRAVQAALVDWTQQYSSALNVSTGEAFHTV